MKDHKLMPEKSDYAKREEDRRYLVFLANGNLHGAYRDLYQQRIQAVENADTQAFQRIENDIQQLHNVQQSEQPVQSQPADNAITNAVKEFEVRNHSWYNDSEDNEELVALAERLDKKYFEQIPDHNARLTFVEAKVKQKFATHKAFKNANRDLPAAVAKNAEPRSTSRSTSSQSLSQQQKYMYNYIKQSDPSYTVDQYLADIG